MAFEIQDLVRYDGEPATPNHVKRNIAATAYTFEVLEALLGIPFPIIGVEVNQARGIVRFLITGSDLPIKHEGAEVPEVVVNDIYNQEWEQWMRDHGRAGEV